MPVSRYIREARVSSITVPDTTLTLPPTGLIVPKFKATVEQDKLVADGWRPTWDETFEEYLMLPPAVEMEFIPHPDAPLFNNGDEGRATMAHLINEVTSDNFHPTPEVLELLRQASLVSLYFFLKYIAGAYGPYGDLSDHLHVEVANFRQRMLHAGARGAVFLPRSFYKSTVCTHGAIAWELLRDPNLRVGLVASNSDMAEQFMGPAKMVFEANPLVEILFPDHCPAKGENGNVIEKVWNNRRIVMPNRTIQMPEPSIKTLGAGGSAAGNHFDLLSVDDLVSEKELDSDRGVGADMVKKSQWFSTNQDTLLISPKKSRVFLSATRYAVNDPYDQVFSELRKKTGYWDELPYKINTEIGLWDVYYRMAIEKDRYIFPEKMGKKELDRIYKKDQWAYFTQYLNNPFSAAATEFIQYPIKECTLDNTTGRGITIHFFHNGEHETVNLRDCEVTIGVDPAASEKKASNKTSRTAIIVRARDHLDRHFYIDGAVGYFSPREFYTNIFGLAGKYRDYIRSTNFEVQAAFKFVFNTLVEMQNDHKENRPKLRLRKITPLPDKDGKIRNFLQPLLEMGLMYATPMISKPIKEELEVFPGGTKRDTLDAMELADRYSFKPKGKMGQDDDRIAPQRDHNKGNRVGY